MWLVVGLGNPGPTYRHTRHNVGFLVVDRLAHRGRVSAWQERFHARVTRLRIANSPVALLQPQTFMNRSGSAVRPAADAMLVEPTQILVIHDDVDLPHGALRLKEGGGHGGHRGLRSLVEELGSRDFLRVRVGIGRPEQGEVSDYVLDTFSPDQQADLPALLDHAADAVEAVLEQGLALAANRFNRRAKPAAAPVDEPAAEPTVEPSKKNENPGKPETP